jgi:two-component system phosphate regulon response regulator PhoB
MNRLAVLIVEDEPEVRDALARDLEPLSRSLRVETADDVEDARAAVIEIVADGSRLALVLADHRLPGTTGVDFLVELNADPDTATTRKVLVTGQADHADTIRAVNEAGLDHYIAKPWDPDELISVSVAAVTDYIIAEGIDPLPYVRDLDGQRLLDHYARRASDR